MNNKERLQRLKQLQIERHEGALFKSAEDCMLWIDNVAPLLKYDKAHYKNFQAHAQYVRMTSLSANAIMSHLNSMIGIVNQAVIELENKIKPTLSISAIRTIWHDSFWGKVLVSVVAGTILIFIGFLINKFILSTTIQQKTQQQESLSKQTGQDNTKNQKINMK